jgi:hypothetical protein
MLLRIREYELGLVLDDRFCICSVREMLFNGCWNDMIPTNSSLHELLMGKAYYDTAGCFIAASRICASLNTSDGTDPKLHSARCILLFVIPSLVSPNIDRTSLQMHQLPPTTLVYVIFSTFTLSTPFASFLNW